MAVLPEHVNRASVLAADQADRTAFGLLAMVLSGVSVSVVWSGPCFDHCRPRSIRLVRDACGCARFEPVQPQASMVGRSSGLRSVKGSAADPSITLALPSSSIAAANSQVIRLTRSSESTRNTSPPATAAANASRSPGGGPACRRVVTSENSPTMVHLARSRTNRASAPTGGPATESGQPVCRSPGRSRRRGCTGRARPDRLAADSRP